MKKEKEAYLNYLIEKHLVNSKGILNINEYDLIKNHGLSQELIEELKSYLIYKYGTIYSLKK